MEHGPQNVFSLPPHRVKNVKSELVGTPSHCGRNKLALQICRRMRYDYMIKNLKQNKNDGNVFTSKGHEESSPFCFSKNMVKWMSPQIRNIALSGLHPSYYKHNHRQLQIVVLRRNHTRLAGKYQTIFGGPCEQIFPVNPQKGSWTWFPRKLSAKNGPVFAPSWVKNF